MKNPELMMYRVAIGQILADAGINRTTIEEMVQETVKEKVEKHLGHVFTKVMSQESAECRIREAVRIALRDIVREELKNIRIEVNAFPKNKEDNNAAD